MQTQLTNSQVQVQIAENQGEAELARARKQAEQMVVDGRGREPAARCSPAAARLARLAGRSVRGVGPAPQDRVVRRPAAVCAGAGRRAAGAQHAAARARARVHRRAGSGSPASRATGRLGASQGMLGSCSTCWSPRSRASASPRSHDNSALHELADRMAAQALESMGHAAAPIRPEAVVAASTDENGAIKAGSLNSIGTVPPPIRIGDPPRNSPGGHHPPSHPGPPRPRMRSGIPMRTFNPRIIRRHSLC